VTWTEDPNVGPEGVTPAATASNGIGTIVGAVPETAGVALSLGSVSLTEAAGAPVATSATFTVATIAPSSPTPTGSVTVDVQVKVSFATVVVDRPQM